MTPQTHRIFSCFQSWTLGKHSEICSNSPIELKERRIGPNCQFSIGVATLLNSQAYSMIFCGRSHAVSWRIIMSVGKSIFRLNVWFIWNAVPIICQIVLHIPSKTLHENAIKIKWSKVSGVWGPRRGERARRGFVVFGGRYLTLAIAIHCVHIKL